MKIRHLVIFGVLLALLGAGVLWKSRQKPAELVTEEYSPLGYSFNEEQVTRIEIGKGKAPKLIELQKTPDGNWILPNFFNARADRKKIQDLMKAFKESKGELRGKDKALLGDFELTEDVAYRIALLDASGKPVFELFLSPKVTRYAAAFTRKGGSDKVFLTEGDLFGKIGLYEDPAKTLPQSDYWASLILTDPKPDLIDELTIKRFKDGREMIAAQVRRETDPNDLAKKWWKYAGARVPFSPDAAKIKEFFKVFETRPASKALDPKAKDYGFSKPAWQMKLHQEDGQEILVTAGAGDPAMQGTYVQISNQPVVLLFPKYYMNDADVDDSKFFGENPLSIDTEKIEKIFIHTPAGEIDISPKTDKREAVVRYMDNLKGLSVSKLIFDSEAKIKSNSGQLNWIEIRKEGVPETFFLDVEGTPYQGGKEYLAQKRDGTLPFVIPESSFKNLFGDISALKPAAEPEKK